MHRITIALRNKNGEVIVPKFSECLLKFFRKDVNSVTVKFLLENGTIFLTESEEGYELHHSPVCPMKLSAEVSNINEDDKRIEKEAPNIGLAASVVIESSDKHVLLTKRSPHMRASPNAWVLPGGHLELGETVFEAAARETKEETALEITNERASILGLWENVYPAFLGAGAPKYHVLVVYLHTCVNESYTELTKKIIPEPKEVSAYCWLNTSVISKLLQGDENINCDGKQYIYDSGKIVEKSLDYHTMFNNWLRTQPEPYSGVNFALRKWIEKINSEHQTSKY